MRILYMYDSGGNRDGDGVLIETQHPTDPKFWIGVGAHRTGGHYLSWGTSETDEQGPISVRDLYLEHTNLIPLALELAKNMPLSPEFPTIEIHYQGISGRCHDVYSAAAGAFPEPMG